LIANRNSESTTELIGKELTQVFFLNGKREIHPTCKRGCRGEQNLDEVLELLDKTTKRTQKLFEENKETAQRQTTAYEQILQMKDTTEEQRIKAFMGRMFAYDRLDRLSSQLSLLYTLQIFAFKVKVLEVSVDKIDEQLEKSGVLAKGNEIADIRKHIDALKILVEAQYESLKDLKEKGKDLPYIF
jgi:hypothetical protein